VILDTPPSRNALDFLDAPDRLTAFFQGRALRLFLAPTGLAARVMGRGTGVVFAVLKRVTGVDLLQDLSVFFRSLGGVVDGFAERAAGVKELLADPATTFLIVTSPQREPVDEAIFFRGKLREAAMPFGGLIVNRVDPGVGEAEPLDPARTEAELAGPLGPALARKVAQTVADAAGAGRAGPRRDRPPARRARRARPDPRPPPGRRRPRRRRARPRPPPPVRPAEDRERLLAEAARG
jgi:anion-transporting  ArsA/GET3 family ATPase